MKHAQRGFAIPGIADLVLYVALAGIIAGMLYAVKSYIEKRDATIFAAGQSEANVAWQARELEREQLNRQLIKKMNDRYKAEQERHQLQVTHLLQAHLEVERNEKAKQDKLLAAARAGTLRLRDRYRKDQAAACGGRSGSGATGTAPAPAGTDAERGGYLSTEATEFLLRLTADADRVVRKLGSLQTYTVTLWEFCQPHASN